MFRRRLSVDMRDWIRDRLEWDVEWADERLLNAEDEAEAEAGRQYLAWLRELQREAERL